MIINLAMFFGLIYSIVLILLTQGLIICMVNKVKRSQELLENHFMGPEVNSIAREAGVLATT